MHDILFLLSGLSVVVDGPLMTDATGDQDICPCPCLCLCLLLSPFRKRGKLVHWLVPAVHLLQDQGHGPMYQQDEQLGPIQLPLKQ